jgi:hypothetical protein
MDRACSVHGRDEKCIQNCGMKSDGKYHFGDVEVDGRIETGRTLKKYHLRVLCLTT